MTETHLTDNVIGSEVIKQRRDIEIQRKRPSVILATVAVVKFMEFRGYDDYMGLPVVEVETLPPDKLLEVR